MLGAALACAHAQAPADGSWRMPAGDHAATRYSPLAQITAANAPSLVEAFSVPLGTDRGQEAAPLVVDGTMYLVMPYPNTVLALDLARRGALKWKFEPQPDAGAQGVACCDVVNRGAAYDEGRLFFNTLDNQTIALDAKSGKELWRVQLGDIRRGETMTKIGRAHV